MFADPALMQNQQLLMESTMTCKIDIVQGPGAQAARQ